MDRRVERTYDALQQSMRRLLGQHCWSQITTQRLCDMAGISRTTFYTHFDNKDDLLDSLLASFEKAMLAENNGRSLSENGKLRFLPLLAIHVSENRRTFHATNSTADGYPVAASFKSLIERRVKGEVEEANLLDDEHALLCEFIGAGLYGALVAWSASSSELTHLDLLARLDRHVYSCLPEGKGA